MRYQAAFGTKSAEQPRSEWASLDELSGFRRYACILGSHIAIFVAAFLALAVCQRVFKDDRNACLVPYILFHFSAAGCGIVAAVRGNKWWLLMSLFAVALAVQALGAMVVE